MDQGSVWRSAVTLHCRQTWPADGFRHHACVHSCMVLYHHASVRRGSSCMDHGSVDRRASCGECCDFILLAIWACRLVQAPCLCAQLHGARPPCCGEGGQQQHNSWQCVEKGSMWRVL